MLLRKALILGVTLLAAAITSGLTDFSLDAQAYPNPSRRDLVIRDVSAFLDQRGYLHIRGVASNSGPARLYPAEVAITVYDFQGNSLVTAIRSVEISGFIMEPGMDYPFEETFHLVSLRQWPGRYSVDGYGQEYLGCGPSGPPPEIGVGDVFEARPPPWEAFYSVGNALVLVASWNASESTWELWSTSTVPFAWTLRFLELGRAYWMLLADDCTLSWRGYQAELKKGWNLISWPPVGSKGS